MDRAQPILARKLLNVIPYGRQTIEEDDVEAVVGVLRSDFLTQGPAVPEFERAVTAYCGAQFGVAVNSATSALHLACKALGLGPGSRAWTSPISFVASANCILYCGASVDFVDVDPSTANISTDALEEKLRVAEREGNLPAVVIPVHMCGQSCDMKRIWELGQRFGFRIIEDASHAIGARYHDEPVGNCRYSDVTVFSFHPVKIVTTGEGGMAVTNNPALAERMVLLRSHGITRDSAAMASSSEGGWYYEQRDLGFNYRMTDIQAALGCSQMSKLERFVSARARLADRYTNALASGPAQPLMRSAECTSSWHLYVVAVEDRRRVYDAMRSAGIGVNVHYIPIYRQPYYRLLGPIQRPLPGAETYYSKALTLPLYPQMTDGQQDHVVNTLARVLDYPA